jgi:AmiR/NasT family two-component response regulator
VDEARAYGLLRKSAMDRKLRIGVVAQQLIDAEEPYGGA